MKIFVVTAGQYSDYGICAMFTTKEHAEAYIKVVNPGDVNDIEEWELDKFSDDLDNGRLPFRVFMAKDGSVREVKPVTYDFDKGCKLICGFPRYKHSTVELQCTCWTKDEQTAIKIANEKRAQIIAMNLWREVSEMPARCWYVDVEV